MELIKKGVLTQENNNIEITIKFFIDDDFDISVFGKDTINIFNIDISDIKIENISDEIYKRIKDLYKKFNITIEIILNNSIGYKKQYNASNIIILSKNNITKGIVVANEFDANVYNIKNIPQNIKDEICGCSTVNPQPDPIPTPPPPPQPPVQPTTTNVNDSQPTNNDQIYNIPSLDLNIDPDLTNNSTSDENPSEPTTPSPSNTPEPSDDTSTNKKIDISQSPVFNDIFDKTIKMMDNIGPSEDLIADLSRPDPSVMDMLKGHFGNKS